MITEARSKSAPLASLSTLYRARLARRYDTIEFLGLPNLREEQPLRLGEIYIPLSLMWKPNGERIFVPAALKESPHLVVLGDPGSGKSTLIKVLTHSFASLTSSPMARIFGPHLPIPIILRDHNVSAWETPEQILADFLKTLDADVQDEFSVEWLLEALREGRGILLLDGLDEVGSMETRRRLLGMLSGLLPQIRKSLVVATSRIVGFDEAPIDRPALLEPPTEPGRPLIFDQLSVGGAFRRCYVASFTTEETEQFVSHWYAAREPEARLRERSVVSFRSALRASESIRRLASNPFLLTLMALIHRVTADLPSGRVKLYEKVVEAYLETIQRFRGLQCYDAPLDQMKRWLAEVGWQMQCRRSGNADVELLASREDLLGWLKEAMAKDRSEAETEAVQFLEYVRRRSGLLIEKGDGKFAFAHLTFQEYFTAWRLRGLLRRFDELVQECVSRIRTPHWHETLVLLFELLAEFPEAGDDLVLRIRARCEGGSDSMGTAAAFFGELLADAACGISFAVQTELFATLLDSLNMGVGLFEIALRIPEGARRRLGDPWVEDRLRSAPDLGEKFLSALLLVVGRSEGRDLLSTVVARGPDLAWREMQILEIATQANEESVTQWASKRLPFSAWFHPMWLAYKCRASLLRAGDVSATCRVLLETAGLFTLLRAELIPRLTLSVQVNTTMFPWPGVMSAPQGYSFFGEDSWMGAVPDWIRFYLGGGKSPSESLTISLFSAGVFQWRLPHPAYTQGAEVLWAERLASRPFAPLEEVRAHCDLLRARLKAADDWSRLLALSSLIVVGEGDPEIVSDRNHLLRMLLDNVDEFVFPTEVSEEIGRWGVRAQIPEVVRQTLFGAPDDWWPDPQWFDRSRKNDPAHPAYFLCAYPAEFWQRAAALLEPDANGDLSRFLLALRERQAAERTITG